ncbi:MAG: hypothetical protein ACOCQW_00520 [Halanaerobiaceae bacterium]
MTKILKHISFARDWLDRAEEKIKSENLIEGEVFLSLAESEVRKAWEFSLFRRKNAEEKKVSHRRNRVLSFVAVIILLFVVVFTTANYLYNPLNEPEQLKLSLTEGYRNMNELSEREKELRLINVDLMIRGNYDRRR